MENETTNATIKVMKQDLVVRPDRFDGTNFTHQQDKLKFLLTALKIFYVIDPNLPAILEPTDKDTEERKVECKKRQEDECICRGHILNALSDSLYDLYIDTPSTKEIWNALKFKYRAEEEGNKKFRISKYFDFTMFDDKLILSQVHELQVIVNKLRGVKIDLPEPFQVSAITTKFPPSRKGQRKKLLHNSEDFSLEQIQNHLRIKEEQRVRDKNENSYPGTSKANTVSKPIHANKRYQNK